MSFCECGCGKECKRRFINGHNLKGKESHFKNKKRGPQTLEHIERRISKIRGVARKRGWHQTEGWRKKISMAVSGSRNWNWKGATFDEYGSEFTFELKEIIRKSNNFKCYFCMKHTDELGQRLSVHHMDDDKKNNSIDNLIPFCRRCHAKISALKIVLLYKDNIYPGWYPVQKVAKGCRPLEVII